MATPVAFIAPNGGITMGRSPQNFPERLADGQGTNWCRNIAENFNWLSKVHCTNVTDDRRQTDGRASVCRLLYYYIINERNVVTFG